MRGRRSSDRVGNPSAFRFLASNLHRKKRTARTNALSSLRDYHEKVRTENWLLGGGLNLCHLARLFPAQQMPGFFVLVVFRSGHCRVQTYRRHSQHNFFGKNVPGIFWDDIRCDEIERVLLVNMVLGSDRAVVATPHLVDGGLHLDPDNSLALVMDQGVVSGRLAPGPRRAQALFHAAGCETQFCPCSAVFGILDVHPTTFSHAPTLVSMFWPDSPPRPNEKRGHHWPPNSRTLFNFHILFRKRKVYECGRLLW